MSEDEFEQIWTDIETYLFDEGFEEYRDLEEEHEKAATFRTEYGSGSYGYWDTDLYVYSPLSQIYLVGSHSEEILDELHRLASWQA